MKEIGNQINAKEKGELFILKLEMNIEAKLKIIKGMEKVYVTILMAMFMMESGSKIKEKEKGK